MSTKKIAVAAALAVALTISTLAAAGSSAASPAPVSGTVALGAPTAPAAVDWSWDIPKGQTFNNPRDRTAWRIIDKIKRQIKNTPAWHKIFVMTWNLQSKGIVRLLGDAHDRGVQVQLIMSRQLANAQGYHGSYRTLKRRLARGNWKRPPHRRSRVLTCSNSCRGRGGSMHSKFIMSTRSGKHRYVVSQGSANFTSAAATRQWNDWYTIYSHRRTWQTYRQVFAQAKRDRPAGFATTYERGTWSWFAPWWGNGDVVMKLLNKVRCHGAVGAGVNGRTAIRVGSSVFQHNRGLRIARKLRGLHSNGCNVRVVFTMMTNKIRNALGGVPKRHLVYDWNGDGSFDRYLHMKAMTISGHWGGDRGHRLVFNGSANWSWIGVVSDEQGMVVHNRWREKAYARWINYLFNSAPRHARPAAEYYTARGLKNPYHELELELAGQG